MKRPATKMIEEEFGQPRPAPAEAAPAPASVAPADSNTTPRKRGGKSEE